MGWSERLDLVERDGVVASHDHVGPQPTHELEQAEIVLLVTDLTNPMKLIAERIGKIRERVSDQAFIIVGNKADLAGREKIQEMLAWVDLADNENIVFISAKQQQNLDSLIELLKESANLQQAEGADVIVSNIRHYEALT